jgi:hypothetical protein
VGRALGSLGWLVDEPPHATMAADPIIIFKRIGWHAAASASHTEDVKVERLRCPLPVLKESQISSHGSMGTVDGHLFLQVECIPERYYS